MGNISDEVRLLDEEIKEIQGEIKSLEVMYEIHSLQQTLDKYDEIPINDVILSSTEEKLLSKLKELNSPLLNFPTVCDQLEEYNRRLGILARSREDRLTSILQNTPQPEPEKQAPANTPEVIPFPTPPATQWHEVEISFMDNENVKISARKETRTRHFAEMGFRKGKSAKPVKAWYVLLSFSKNESLKFPHSTKTTIEKGIQNLRKRLKAYFGIQDDPIILERGYRPKFKVSGSESQGRSVHTFSNSDLFDENKED